MVDQALLQTAFPHLLNVPNIGNVVWNNSIHKEITCCMVDNAEVKPELGQLGDKYREVATRANWLWVAELINTHIPCVEYIRTVIAKNGTDKALLDVVRNNMQYLMSDVIAFLTSNSPDTDRQRLDKIRTTVIGIGVIHQIRRDIADLEPPYGVWRVNDYMARIMDLMVPFCGVIACPPINETIAHNLMILIQTLFRVIVITTGEVPLHQRHPHEVPDARVFDYEKFISVARGVVNKTGFWTINTIPNITFSFKFLAELRSCLTSTSIQVAKTIVDKRSFSDMPILADALQDAGYNNEYELNRLRDSYSLFTIADRQLTIPLWSARLP